MIIAMRLLASPLAVNVVLALRQSGRASLAELARTLDMTPSSVQRALGILVDDGLVRAIGAGRARAYELDTASPLLDPVERLGEAVLTPVERARLVGRSNPAIELIGHTSREMVVIFAKRGDASDEARAARALGDVAARLELELRLVDHEDARRAGSGNAALRAALTGGEVVFGDLDAAVPERSGHRTGAGRALGRLNPSLRLPSARVLDALKRRHGVRRMRAFGSPVRSDFRPDSDVDIMVQLAPDADRSLESLASLEQDLERKLGRDVDVVLEDEVHPAFRWAIGDEAVAI